MKNNILKFNSTNAYINLTIILLYILSIYIFSYSIDKQKSDYITLLNNVKIQLEQITTNQINTLKILTQSFKDDYDIKDEISIKYADKIHNIDNIGNFALDNENLINVTGYGGVSKNKEIIKEMDVAILMTKKFQTSKKFSKTYAWLYYASKNKFSTIWPYIDSREYGWKESDQNKNLFKYATPKYNPTKKIFFTPLYVDSAGLGLMVTLGYPVYINNEFLGTMNLDVTLKHISTFLKKNVKENISMIVVNKNDQIIGAHNIKSFNNEKIYKLDQIMPLDILGNIKKPRKLNLMNGNYYQGDYFYIRKYTNAPWRLIAYVKQSTILLNAFLLIIPILILIAFLYKIISYNKKIAKMAYHDSLTGLANRYYLNEFEKSIIANAKRLELPICIALVDIDKFKYINDKYGHTVGDKVLKKFVNLIQGNIRESDLFVRYGGEEFVILFINARVNDITRVSNKLIKIVENAKIIDNEVITVSIGLVEMDIHNERLNDTIKRADLKLYEAKETGRNKVIV